MTELLAVLEQQPDITVVSRADDYLLCEARRGIAMVDDVEFLFSPNQRDLEIRSASRERQRPSALAPVHGSGRWHVGKLSEGWLDVLGVSSRLTAIYVRARARTHTHTHTHTCIHVYVHIHIHMHACTYTYTYAYTYTYTYT